MVILDVLDDGTCEFRVRSLRVPFYLAFLELGFRADGIMFQSAPKEIILLLVAIKQSWFWLMGWSARFLHAACLISKLIGLVIPLHGCLRFRLVVHIRVSLGVSKILGYRVPPKRP